jgi:hypothetical protein
VEERNERKFEMMKWKRNVNKKHSKIMDKYDKRVKKTTKI